MLFIYCCGERSGVLMHHNVEYKSRWGLNGKHVPTCTNLIKQPKWSK